MNVCGLILAGLSKLAAGAVDVDSELGCVEIEQACNVSNVTIATGFRSAFMLYLPYSETGGFYYGILVIQN
jgi:hypothetical protein